MGFALFPDVGERSRVIAAEYIEIDRSVRVRVGDQQTPVTQAG
jgi:hypothetical protein